MKTKIFSLFFFCLIIFCINHVSAGDELYWQQFKTKFIHDSGRIIDTGNNDISHSEGQGVAMLFATFWHDKETFDRVWKWTQKNLQIRNDKLFAWKWVPDASGGRVDDVNNATDGDLMIAWSLIRAYEQWKDSQYLKQAQLILEDIRKKMIVQQGDLLIILPAEKGFIKNDGVIINLSYWIFPAIQHVAKVFKDQTEWDKLMASGLQLLQNAHFGRWGLPPNWLLLNTKPMLPASFPTRFGYDAVRIPLYLIWAGIIRDDLLKSYRDFWNYFHGASFLPAWTDLTNDSVDSYDAPYGIHAIRDLVVDHGLTLAMSEAEDYYSMSLTLMAIIAYNEGIIKNKK